MSQCIEVDNRVWRYTGATAGKTIAVVGGTHGNELTGIEVVRRMRERCVSIDVGVLYVIEGNPRAIERGERGSIDHADLNRQFTRTVMDRHEHTYECERAKVLAPIFASCDVVIDIHSTNKPSDPMLIPPTFTQAHKRLFQWFNCDRVCDDPRSVLLGQPSTIDDFTQLHGGIGMAFESGEASDVSRVDEVYESVMNVLRDQGMIAQSPSREPYRTSWDVYRLVDRVDMTHDDFMFAEGRGERSFEPFSVGDVLCRQGGRDVVARYDGFIMFPKVPHLRSKGLPVMFLAKSV